MDEDTSKIEGSWEVYNWMWQQKRKTNQNLQFVDQNISISMWTNIKNWQVILSAAY